MTGRERAEMLLWIFSYQTPNRRMAAIEMNLNLGRLTSAEALALAEMRLEDTRNVTRGGQA